MAAGRDQQLLALFAEDRAEHRDLLAGTPAYHALRARDRIRREQVMALIADGWPRDAEALYAAAWVLNHGDASDEAFLGHRLASAARDLAHEPALWLAAAALDRSLMYAGRPQKYGTNTVPDGVGWRVWDVDPATTDAERAANGVPPLAELEARAAAITGPQPDMAAAPGWLTAAIRRWRES